MREAPVGTAGSTTGSAAGTAAGTGDAAREVGPWEAAGLPPLGPYRITMHRCSKCGMAFHVKADMTRHLALPKCAGAVDVVAECEVVGPGCEPAAPRQKRQRIDAVGSVTNVHGNQNTATTVHDNSVHIQQLTIVVAGDAAGDVVRAGSAFESELIRKTIVENANLRRMLRTIENAPAAIFQMTKGAGGPQQLRNVKKVGRRACELTPDGPETSGLIEYCKRTAVAMVDELRQAVASVTDDAPPAVREWAHDVSRSLTHKVHGAVDYVSALKLYNEASSKFYKLPKPAREAIACGVRDIERFIADSAAF